MSRTIEESRAILERWGKVVCWSELRDVHDVPRVWCDMRTGNPALGQSCAYHLRLAVQLAVHGAIVFTHDDVDHATALSAAAAWALRDCPEIEEVSPGAKNACDHEHLEECRANARAQAMRVWQERGENLWDGVDVPVLRTWWP